MRDCFETLVVRKQRMDKNILQKKSGKEGNVGVGRKGLEHKVTLALEET